MEGDGAIATVALIHLKYLLGRRVCHSSLSLDNFVGCTPRSRQLHPLFHPSSSRTSTTSRVITIVASIVA